jgi:hypothetical protein
LSYRSPQLEDRPNSPAKVVARIAVGAAAGMLCSIAGVVLMGVFNNGWFFYVPFLFVIGGAAFVAIRFRRFGYVTGVIVGPFILATGIFVLLLILCGGLALRP